MAALVVLGGKVRFENVWVEDCGTAISVAGGQVTAESVTFAGCHTGFAVADGARLSVTNAKQTFPCGTQRVSRRRPKAVRHKLNRKRKK